MIQPPCIFCVAMIQELDTVSAAVKALGGSLAVAKLTGRPIQAVSNWKGNGWFPPATFLVLSAELARAGYSAPPSLWRIEEPPPASASEIPHIPS